MAEEDRDIKVMQVAWSSHQLPLFELVVKFPLPFLVKSATTSGGSRIGAGGRILAGEIYRMQRLLRVQKVLAQVNEDSLSTDLRNLPGMDAMEISIPKDYHGPFQILPADDTHATSIKDILKSMPRYIKVLTSIRRKPTEVQLEAGDILEVLGTTRRLTKVGVVEFLRLQKKHREFVLHPDFEGNFEVLEDKTQYTLTEILDRFPLPQQVCISKPEQHSETLLNKLPAKEHDDDVKLTLKREYQKEYVIGVDMYGRVGVVVDMDADVQFFLPNASRNHSNACTAEHDIIHRILTKSTQSNGELRMDQVICQKEEKLVLCKPWQQLFKDSPPVLPFRRPSGEISTVSVSSGSNIADDATTNSDDSHYRSVTYDSVTDSDSGHDTLDEEPTISTGKIYEGHKNLMDGQVRNINHMNESTLSKNEPGHDRRNTLQKRRNKIITSPYVNIAIVPPERKPTHAPVPSLTLERTHNRALHDDHPCSSNTTQEQYAPFSTSLPNRSHFLEDEDIMYQNCVPNTTTSIVYQNSVQDGIRPPSHYKPKPHPRKSSFKRTVENGQDPRPQVWQRRETERKEIQTPTRLPSCPITPPAYKEMDLNDNVFVDSQTSFQNTKGATTSTTLPLPDICSDTSPEIIQDETQHNLPRYRQNLKRLTVDEVVDVLKALKIGSEAQQLFRDNDVDGVLFSCLDEKILQDEFELSKFHSLKITKFIKGWRPVTRV